LQQNTVLTLSNINGDKVGSFNLEIGEVEYIMATDKYPVDT